MTLGNPQQAPQRISRFWPFRNSFYGWAVLTAGVLSSFASVTTQGPIVGIFNQQIRDELGWSVTDFSIAFVAGTVGGGILSPLMGKILDKRGARAVSVVAGCVIALALASTSLIQEPWHFWVLLGIARAVTASGAQLSVMVAVASWFVRMRGRAVGLVGTGQRAGQSLLPLPLVAVIGLLSWREAWIALAGVVVLLLVLPSAALVRRRPEEYGLLPDGQVVAGAGQESMEVVSQTVEASWTLAQARRTRQLWLLIVAQGGVVLCLNATNLHMAAHLQDKGLSLGLSATVLTVFATTGALTVLPWGFLMERLHVRHLGLTSSGLFVVSMLLLINATSLQAGLAFGLLYGVAIGAWTVTSRALFANYFGRRHFGSIRGFAGLLIVVANPAGPILAGVIRDRSESFDTAFMLFAGVFVVSFLSFLVAVPLRQPPLDETAAT